MGDRKRRQRGQVVKIDGRTFGVRVQTKERAANGRLKTHYETLYNTTEVKAYKRRDELLAQIEAGLFFRPAPMTVAALVEEWLEQKKRAGLRHASIYTYTDAASAYLTPHIGHLELRELTPVVVRNLYNTLQDRKLSDRTLKYARTVLSLIIRDAISWGYLKENPANGIQVPQGGEGRTAYCMDVDEARALIETARLDPRDLVFAFAVLTGLRPAEYLGLPRQHIEMCAQNGTERGLVKVRQIATKIRQGGWVFPKPKTKKAIRDVPFSAWLYHELETLGRLNDSQRRMMGSDWAEHSLVFPSRSGTPQCAEWLERGRFKRLLKRAGLASHFTLYSLRYTYATLQFLAGERDKVISDLMGHVKVDFTKDVYTKVLPVMREQASDSLERLLFGDVRTTLAQSASELSM